MLAGLFPGRIDLGIGRAAGTDPLTTFALQRDRRQAAPDDFPQQLAELLAYLDGTPARRPPLRAAGEDAARPARAARAVAARLLAAERDLGRRARPALRVRRLHQPDGAEIARDYRARFADTSSRPRAAHGGRRVGDLRRDRRGGRSGWRPAARMALHAAAPGPPDRGAAAREGAALPRSSSGRGADGAARAARSSARPRPCARGLEEVAARVRRRRGDRRHDHPRPRGAPALLRADRRGLRPWPRSIDPRGASPPWPFARADCPRVQVTRHDVARPIDSDSAHGDESSTDHRWIPAADDLDDRVRTTAAGELVAELEAAGVERLIDVRYRPQSRRPGMSKTRLGELLGDHGIVYEQSQGARHAAGHPLPLQVRQAAPRARPLFRAHVEEHAGPRARTTRRPSSTAGRAPRCSASRPTRPSATAACSPSCCARAVPGSKSSTSSVRPIPT